LVFHSQLCSEQDQARLIVQAALGWEQGEWPNRSYPLRTSPLTLLLLRWALVVGVPLHALPALQGAVNALSGALAVALAYLLVRRLIGGPGTLIGGALVMLNPALWFGATGGMPHVPSLACFLGALHLYLGGVDARGRARPVRWCLAAALMTVACGIKADIALCSFAFLGLALMRREPLSVRTVVPAGLVPLVAIVVTLLLPQVMVPDLEAGFAASWTGEFPFALHNFFRLPHIRVWITMFGWAVFLTLPLAVVGAWPHADLRRLLLLVALWSVPAVLFWGFRFGNSARHMMASLPPILLLYAEVVARRTPPRRASALLAGVVIVNVLIGRPHTWTGAPSSRLFTSALMLQDKARLIHAASRQFVLSTAPRKAWAKPWSSPYTAFETLAATELVSYADYPPIIVVRRGTHTSQVLLDAPKQDAERLRRDGWEVWPRADGTGESGTKAR
jgi:hypothetical protein